MPDDAWSNLNADFHLVDQNGTSYRIRPPHTYLFGRDDFAHFQINDVLTSRRHCELRWELDQGWLLVDLSSRNGTLLNGCRIEQPHVLKDHDALRVGGQHLTFLMLPRGADVAAYMQSAADGNTTYEAVPGAGPTMVAGGSFSGTIGQAGLLPILEFLLVTGKNGSLDVDGGAERCIWFVDGEPRDARYGDKEGSEALDELLTLSGAGFTFHEGVAPPRGVVIEGDANRLLATLARGQSPVDANDINCAQALQARMLERIPSLAGYDVSVRYAAISGVGGDFYDIGPLPDGRVLITLGDVSGHGVQGALVVAMALKTLRLLRTNIDDPVQLLARFNDEIKPDLLPGQFITLFMAALEPATGRLQVVLAGHHPGFLVDAAGVHSVGKLGVAIGMVGGAQVKASLSSVQVDLAPGGLLFQCTDGLLEAHRGSNDDEFGAERLEASLSRHGRCAQAAAVVAGVEADLTQFTGGHLDDDLTLLVLLRHPL
jgi:serine phosphatase RsbU (regulator of sigma subunit)